MHEYLEDREERKSLTSFQSRGLKGTIDEAEAFDIEVELRLKDQMGNTYNSNTVHHAV